MKITLDEIKRLEKLSALSSSEEKLLSLVKDFEQIADFVEQVTSVDIDEENTFGRIVQIKDLREDEIIPSFSQEEILANAPEKGEGAFIVPKVVE